VLAYTLLGGMWSVAITTFIQMIVIVLGLLYIAFEVSDLAGGAGKVIRHAADAGKFEWLPEANIGAIIAWIATLLTMAFGSIPQQDVFQRANSARNENVAVNGTVLGGIAYFLFAGIPLFLAYSAVQIDPALVERYMAEDSQLILPNLILNHMPFTAQVIFFGALLSVIMSTASGTLLAPSVTFSENILRGFMPNLSDRAFLQLTRVTVVVFAIIVTGYAMQTESTIHEMVENAYKVTLAAAFVPLAAGLYWRRANNLGAALAIVFGLTTWIALEFISPEGIIPPQLAGLCVSAVGMLIGGLAGRQQRAY
jgi:Na+/proline symporter